MSNYQLLGSGMQLEGLGGGCSGEMLSFEPMLRRWWIQEEGRTDDTDLFSLEAVWDCCPPSPVAAVRANVMLSWPALSLSSGSKQRRLVRQDALRQAQGDVLSAYTHCAVKKPKQLLSSTLSIQRTDSRRMSIEIGRSRSIADLAIRHDMRKLPLFLRTSTFDRPP
jgi:hypothetical protein